MYKVLYLDLFQRMSFGCQAMAQETTDQTRKNVYFPQKFPDQAYYKKDTRIFLLMQ